MVDLDFVTLNTDGKEDDHALRYLAGSLIGHWDELAPETRASIYKMAISGKVVGIPHTVQLKQQVDALLRRNGKSG